MTTPTKLIPVSEDWWLLPKQELRVIDDGKEYSVLTVYQDCSHYVFVVYSDGRFQHTRHFHIDATAPGGSRIFRRVPEAEAVTGWRYFIHPRMAGGLNRVGKFGTDEHRCGNTWQTSAHGWTLEKFIEQGWLETDAAGKPLEAETKPVAPVKYYRRPRSGTIYRRREEQLEYNTESDGSGEWFYSNMQDMAETELEEIQWPLPAAPPSPAPVVASFEKFPMSMVWIKPRDSEYRMAITGVYSDALYFAGDQRMRWRTLDPFEYEVAGTDGIWHPLVSDAEGGGK